LANKVIFSTTCSNTFILSQITRVDFEAIDNKPDRIKETNVINLEENHKPITEILEQPEDKPKKTNPFSNVSLLDVMRRFEFSAREKRNERLPNRPIEAVIGMTKSMKRTLDRFGDVISLELIDCTV
jgi:hypothetical protein